MAVTATPALSAWTGISLSIDEIESDWDFERITRVSDTTRLNLHVEEKTSKGLRVGANIGRLTTRISNISGSRNTEKFDASYIGVYIAYPLEITESLSLYNKIGFQYHAGSTIDADADEDEQISWRDAEYIIGLSYRIGDFRIMPFAGINDISGDIEREASTDTFENSDSVSSGINLDLFIDSSSFVRFKFSDGAYRAFSLRFAREF